MWASAAETLDRFFDTTFATYDFVVRDAWDNDEFMTGATVDLLVKGVVVETETFTASTEDPPDGSFSAYYNGQSNHAMTQALSYANAWVESMEHPYGSQEYDEFVMAMEQEAA